jgi:hypothetical protein
MTLIGSKICGPSGCRRADGMSLVLRRRHSDVDHDQIRRSVADQLEQLDRVARLTHDLDTRAFEQARHAFAQQQLILDQHYAHRCSVLHLALPAWAGGPRGRIIVMADIMG